MLQKAPESLLSDPKIAETMLNEWESAMTGHTSKVMFSNKLEEEIYRSSKTKAKSKDVFKGIASRKLPVREDPLPSRGDKGSGNR